MQAIITNSKTPDTVYHVSLRDTVPGQTESEEFRAFDTQESLHHLREYLESTYPGVAIADQRPLHEKIGNDFALAIEGYLTREQLQSVRQANKTNKPEICATHDYCDANIFMAEAFEAHAGHPINLQSDTDTALWSQAWAYAKEEFLS